MIGADNASEAAANAAEEELTTRPDELVPVIEGASELLDKLGIAGLPEPCLAREFELPDGGRSPLRIRVPASPPEGRATVGSPPDPTIRR